MVVAICRTINVEMIILPIFPYCRQTATSVKFIR